MKQRPAVYYFDLTDIVIYAINNITVSGIQRGAIKIVESIVKQDRGRPVFGLIKHPVTGAFMQADLSFMRGNYDLADFVSRFELPCGRDLWLAGKLRKYHGRPLKRIFARCRLGVQWTLSPELRARFPETLAKPSCLSPLKLTYGSVIATLGAGWMTDYRAIHALARGHGCKVAAVVHDLIPLLNPKNTPFFVKDGHGRFRNWLDYICENANLLACNSSFTKRQLENYLKGRHQAGICIMPYPHEFPDSWNSGQCPLRGDVLALLRKRYVLYLGTLQDRKNVLGLLRAWQQLQRENRITLPQLVLAGGKGWGAEDVYRFLKKTSNLSGAVMLIEHPNDAEVELLYRHCKFTVFPSLFEGWGLPIGESLWFGKPVICAGNASMPEIGGKFATYFDHSQPGSLPRAIENMLSHPPALPPDIRASLRTWGDTATAYCKALDGIQAEEAPAGSPRTSRKYAVAESFG